MYRICRVVGVGTAQRGHNLHMMQLVTAPSGVSLQVRAVPVGTPLRITNTPGTGIVDNLIWTVYLEWRTSRAKRWKVAVIRPDHVGADHVLFARTLSRGERPKAALEDLVRRCELGEFTDSTPA